MSVQNQTMHEAEAYLRNTENPTSLYVMIDGKRRRLFINRKENVIGIIAPGKRIRGYLFSDWNAIEKVLYPQPTIRKPTANSYLSTSVLLKQPRSKATGSSASLQPTPKNPLTRTVSRQVQGLTASA